MREGPSIVPEADALELQVLIESADSVASIARLAKVLGSHVAMGYANLAFPPLIVRHAAERCGLDPTPFLEAYEAERRPFAVVEAEDSW